MKWKTKEELQEERNKVAILELEEARDKAQQSLVKFGKVAFTSLGHLDLQETEKNHPVLSTFIADEFPYTLEHGSTKSFYSMEPDTLITTVTVTLE